jgi:hypothetical protein
MAVCLLEADSLHEAACELDIAALAIQVAKVVCQRAPFVSGLG